MADRQLVTYQASAQQAIVLLKSDPVAEAEAAEQRIKEAQELEEKLKAINEAVPTRVYNVSGSTAGAGSGDFHQYRMIRKAEQMRQKRLDEEYKKKGEQEAYEASRREREQQAEARTAKRRAKRLKKKQKKKRRTSDNGDDAATKVGVAPDTSSESESEDGGLPEQAALD